MSDSYRDLIESLRSAVVQPRDAGEATRRRILRDLRAPKAQKRSRLVLGLVAAGIAISTAFALYVATPAAPEPVPKTQVHAHTEPARPAISAGDVGGTQSAQPARAAGQGEQAAKESDRVLLARGTARFDRARGVRAKARDASPPAIAPSDATPTARASITTEAERRALFITAHRLQFRGAPQRALEAWDAYLASDPTGPLRREALYNRAVILARLGRRAEAESALLPFARGAQEGFRQAEAQQLLEQLGRRQP